MREGDALPHTSHIPKRIGGGRRARPRWPCAGGAAVRCAVAPRCESDPVGEWQENTSRVAALHITHKRHQNEKARDARRRLAAPLSPRPRTGLSRVHRGRPWSDRPSRASPSVGAARAPDRSAAAPGGDRTTGDASAAPTRTRTKRTNDGAGRHPHPRAGRVPGATGSGITGTTCVVPGSPGSPLLALILITYWAARCPERQIYIDWAAGSMSAVASR
jgi:hypothetical protein